MHCSEGHSLAFAGVTEALQDAREAAGGSRQGKCCGISPAAAALRRHRQCLAGAQGCIVTVSISFFRFGQAWPCLKFYTLLQRISTLDASCKH